MTWKEYNIMLNFMKVNRFRDNSLFIYSLNLVNYPIREIFLCIILWLFCLFCFLLKRNNFFHNIYMYNSVGLSAFITMSGKILLGTTIPPPQKKKKKTIKNSYRRAGAAPRLILLCQESSPVSPPKPNFALVQNYTFFQFTVNNLQFSLTNCKIDWHCSLKIDSHQN